MLVIFSSCSFPLCCRQICDEVIAKIASKFELIAIGVMVVGSACLVIPFRIALHTMVEGRDHMTTKGGGGLGAALSAWL